MAEPKLTGADHEAWEWRLRAEVHNLRAAVTCFEGHGDPLAELRLAAATWRSWFWFSFNRGYVAEGERILRQALSRNRSAPPSLRAKALQGLCVLMRMQDRLDEARELGEASVSAWREADDSVGVARALIDVSIPMFASGDIGVALAALDESETLARSANDEWALARCFLTLGNLRQFEQDYERAAALHEQSLELWGRVGDRHGEARSLFGLGLSALQRGAIDPARSFIAEGLECARILGDQWIILWCLEAVASLALADGTPERAARLLGAADALREDLGATLPFHVRRDLRGPTEAAVRELLGAEGEVLMAGGRALALKEAAAYAAELTSPEPAR